MKQFSSNLAKCSLLSLSLVLLSGCFNKSDVETTKASTDDADGGTVLCSINGKAVINEADFLNNLNQMIQSNPYFKGATADSLPKELQRKFFEQLVMQALIEEHANSNAIEKNPNFIKAYHEAEKQLKSALKVQVVEKEIYDSISVTDAEVTKHFDENKERFIKVAGGALAIGVRFDTDQAADAFLAKARGAGADFEKLGKEDKAGKFRDFGRVSKDARGGMQFEIVPAPIKEAVLAMPKYPHIEKVKSGKDIWVIKASDKKNTEFFELSEVRPHIENMLKSNKFKDVLDARLKDIRSKLTVVTNEQYFAGKDGAADATDKDDAAEGAEAQPAHQAAAAA
jgi:hypothetical protein